MRTIIIFILLASTAQAQHSRERRAEIRELATQAASASTNPRKDLRDAIARVCVNEANWDSPDDCALIWQVTKRYGRTARAQLLFIYTHSPRATGIIRARKGNAVWTSKLGRCNGGRCGPFGGLYFDRWQRVRDYARDAMRGEIAPPCEGDPITWGGANGLDDAIAASRGIVPLDCAGTKNVGYAKP